MDKFLKRRISDEARPSTSSTSSVKQQKNYRQYDEDYLNMGFFWCGQKNNPIPQCVVCGKKLSNESMVPSKLNRHFTSKHGQLVGKDYNYFKRLREDAGKQAKYFKKVTTISEKAQLASFQVAEIIAKQMKPHTIAESLILPACCKMIETMFGVEAKNEICKIPLSDNTIQRRIEALSINIEENVFKKVLNSRFAMQVDESTDISGKAHLLAFVRFIDGTRIINEFLCCKELPETTKGEDIFNIINLYLKRWNLLWSSCVGISTDGAPSMLGSIKGFVAFVKTQNPNLIITHCFLHREVLVSKTLGAVLKSVLDKVVSMVNFIKSRSLKTRLFKKLCETMESKHECLILYTEIRWLSRGKVLDRVYELRKELYIFFESEDKPEFCELIGNDLWCAQLAYLSELFKQLNAVNTSLQGRNENILTATDKILALKKKIGIWKISTSKESLEMFPSIQKNHAKRLQLLLIDRLTILEKNINYYFPSLEIEQYDWVRYPFLQDVDYSRILTLSEQVELATLSVDRTLRIKHSELPLDEFWISVIAEYKQLSTKALNILLQFSTTYLCELGFSTLTTMKCKKREGLICIENEMRVCLSTTQPQLDEILKIHQAQVSH